MDKLSQRQRIKIDEVERILNKRDSNPTKSSTKSSTESFIQSSSLSSHSSIDSSITPMANLNQTVHSINDSYVICPSAFIIDNDGSDTSSDVDSGGDTNVISDNSNQKYDDNSTLLDAVRDSESAQIIYSSAVFPSSDTIWEFPASVEISYEPSEAERMAHAIFYSVWSDDVTWLWIALFLLTYRF
jgi:hypothetical protein